MIQNILACSLFLIASAISTYAESYRSFKDTNGREMEAKLTRVSGQDVYVELKDGRSTKVDISIFCKADQSYIEEWAKKNLLTSGIFKVRFTTENTKKQDSESGGIQREQYESAYGIEITNDSDENIRDMRIEYLAIKFEDALAAQKRSEGEIVRIQGETKIDYIAARGKAATVTKSVPMLETKLAPGFSWKGGGKKTSKDELQGIWVKIYVDDMLVHQESRPESLSRKEKW